MLCTVTKLGNSRQVCLWRQATQHILYVTSASQHWWTRMVEKMTVKLAVLVNNAIGDIYY